MSAARTDSHGIVTACDQCGQQNRASFDRLDRTFRCGRCQTPLPALFTTVAVSSESDFDRLVGQSLLPVVVDFWAPWCGPCHTVAPELEKVAAANRGRLIVAKLDTEALPAVGQRFGIRSIPTMAVFVAGREVTRASGARPASEIEALIRQALGR